MFECVNLIRGAIAVTVVLISAVYGYYKWTFKYWHRKNFPYLKPEIPFGNLINPIAGKINLAIRVKDLYEEARQKQLKHCGLFFLGRPVYFPIDLDHVKNVMLKDFQYFVDRDFYHNEKNDPLSAHLFAIGGTKWRNLRTKFTPTFTSGKMKMMFQTLVDCEENLQKKIITEYECKRPIDIKEVLGCFTTDVIGSCAFGLDFKTFNEENSPFRIYGKKVFAGSIIIDAIGLFAFNFPDFARKLGVVLTPTDVSNFFLKLVKDTVKYREDNNHVRNDFMQLLIDLKNKVDDVGQSNHDGNSLTIDELAAQCFVFFLAGFETSSTTMAFALYELAKHQHIQNKVRAEINEVLAKHKNKITYEAIQDLKYMNQVIDETLRKYPPLGLVGRKCVKDYKTSDGIAIEKGTTVIIPILGIHYDERYYPEPEKFDPERFTEENKNLIPHFAHIPFGEGPRLCIGMRFGLMQTKVGLTSLLKNFKFTVNKKTQEPFKYQPRSFVLAVEGEIWLDAERV